MFDLWVLLTRRIVDALGRNDQESFVNLVRLDHISTLLPLPAGSIVRLIEVQRRQDVNIDNRDELIKALFPNVEKNEVDPPDARARVVRIFTPIKAI